jgi:hypothetical protein
LSEGFVVTTMTRIPAQNFMLELYVNYDGDSLVIQIESLKTWEKERKRENDEAQIKFFPKAVGE